MYAPSVIKDTNAFDAPNVLDAPNFVEPLIFLMPLMFLMPLYVLDAPYFLDAPYLLPVPCPLPVRYVRQPGDRDANAGLQLHPSLHDCPPPVREWNTRTGTLP